MHQKFALEIDKIKEIKIQSDEDDDIGFNEKFEDNGDVIKNLLRFLQLFAEGHYSDLQNYVRQQYHNYHSYDIIQDMIDLLVVYFKNRKQEYVENMMQLFDTLTEYIQGPCRENQSALIQDAFLDLAQNLLDIDEILENVNIEIKSLTTLTQF